MSEVPISTVFDEITDFLASGPSSEQIIDFKPSEMLDQRLHILLEQNSHDLLTVDERAELVNFCG